MLTTWNSLYPHEHVVERSCEYCPCEAPRVNIVRHISSPGKNNQYSKIEVRFLLNVYRFYFPLYFLKLLKERDTSIRNGTHNSVELG